ncbi:uncharacterized protein MAM_06056 [Metarhizium album ARSEF 1941]|uniref:Uncharacterized protein n=1 Tax=Metarhizium album (strain ARSEF 1941) TaxID=1081103 RepID=A0A0B2WQA8_METAS|nr:uncharacterized protein MAM_06056 [Metarhizium album ARSEF 1941]KHN96208.1 hypothetical protein MAM_06056 [Metarhizium album ARSEF 1941]
MACRQHNLRPASARRMPQRYQGRDAEKRADHRAVSRNHSPAITSPAEPGSPNLGKYCAFPSRALDDPAPGPSELVKATREGNAKGEKEALQRKPRAADRGVSLGEQNPGPWRKVPHPRCRPFPWLTSEEGTEGSTPTSPRTAGTARVPRRKPMASSLARSPVDMETPLVRDDIDWGSDLDDEPPLARPGTTVDNLSAGAQWAMCHVLCEKHPFPRVVQLLGLSGLQIRDFLTTYLAEHKAWEAYEANVAKIPNHKLMGLAAGRSCFVSDLINVYRPALSIDRITREDVRQATEYMKHRGLGRHAEELQDWMGTNTQGFVDLGITESSLLHDKDEICPAREQYSGWIDLEHIKVAAGARAEQMTVEADSRCLINDVFLGLAPHVIPRSAPAASPDKTVRDGVHVAPLRNRFVLAGVPRDMTDLVSIRRFDSDGVSAVSQLMALGGQYVSPLDLDVHKPQISPAQRSAAMEAIQKSRTLHTTGDNSWCAHPALGDTRAAKTDLRRQIISMQALGSLIRPSGAVQSESNGLFETAAGPEVSAVVSGGLSAGYQSFNNRHVETPAIATDDCDIAGKAARLSRVVGRASEAQDARKSFKTGEEMEEVPSPVAEINTMSARLRRELDNRWKHYLREESKAPVGRPKTHRSAPKDAMDDDLDYDPEKVTGKKRKHSAQSQKTPVKCRRLGGTSPNTPVRSQFREMLVGIPSELIKPINLISLDNQQAGSQRPSSLASSAPLSPGSMDPISPCSYRSLKASGDGICGETSRPKKNATPIFGLQRNQELARPVNLAKDAKYAWSAERAEFADICQVAQYALKANRLRHASNDLLGRDAGLPQDALAALNKLKEEFDAVEFQQRGNATRNAEESKFAGCADSALYACEAREADFAMVLSSDESD